MLSVALIHNLTAAAPIASRLAHGRGMTIPTDVLDPADEQRLAADIEVGVFAAHALAHDQRPAGATAAELATLVDVGRSAWERFLLANVGLVRVIASAEAKRTPVPYDELVQEGMVGLMRALQGFDARRGTRFSPYAGWWIRCQVRAAAANRGGQLSLPPRLAGEVWAIRRLEMDLAQELGRLPTLEEVADRRECAPREVARAFAYAAVATPLDVEAESVPASDDARHLAHEVRDLVARLPASEARILSERFGLDGSAPRSYAAIARRLGCSPSHVRRAEARVLEHLRRVAFVPAGAAA